MKPIIYILITIFLILVILGISFLRANNNKIQEISTEITRISQEKVQLDKLFADRLITIKTDFDNMLNDKINDLKNKINDDNLDRVQNDDRTKEQVISIRAELKSAINSYIDEDNRLRNMINGLQKRIDETKGVTGSSDAINQLESRINTQLNLINDSITTLQNTNTNITNTVTDTKLADIQKQIDLLKTSFDSGLLNRIVSQLDSLTTQLSTNTTDITDLRNRINSLPTTLDPVSLQKLETVVNDVKTLQTTVVLKDAYETTIQSINGVISQINTTLQNLPNVYVNKEALQEELLNYVTKNELIADYVKTTKLDEYAKTTDLSGYINIKNLAEDLSGYALKTDLPSLTSYAKFSELDDFKKYANDTYATKDGVTTKLTEYVKTLDLSGYAKKSDLPSSVNLDNYAQKLAIQNQVDTNLLNTNNLNIKNTGQFCIDSICITSNDLNILKTFYSKLPSWPFIREITIIPPPNKLLTILSIVVYDDSNQILSGTYNYIDNLRIVNPSVGIYAFDIITDNTIEQIKNINNTNLISKTFSANQGIHIFLAIGYGYRISKIVFKTNQTNLIIDDITQWLGTRIIFNKVKLAEFSLPLSTTPPSSFSLTTFNDFTIDFRKGTLIIQRAFNLQMVNIP